ncbi:hypothetical protein SCZ71_14310 [Legionella pneumophila serogroup 1]|uniref:Uncharacterized protein n=1 Tax=Legionella pneumophila TaxID=446 RepID=A0AAP3HAZ3_LEGPN|nr:hypothetical protein [Legionella pneumophila]ADG25997.1 hypothetical protein lpa_03808 [Legionella pneumophila 2300/99 Alcoy]MCW8403470.1 hypothetical protein [Legionella pneumophila]MCW8458597.1 hypothetical protein [Legionella pneumophila]MCZ4686542.1 hypothetical protein [Legionella pneumophila]MCZ4691150.1 hypothetical protein [Legionella pneumophila]
MHLNRLEANIDDGRIASKEVLAKEENSEGPFLWVSNQWSFT